MSTVGREVTLFEEVSTREETCNLGHTHRRVAVLRRYILAVVDERVVPNLWSAAWGQPQDTTGLRAVDQFGDEWFRDWDGCHSDGPGDWKTADGRTAARGRGFPDYAEPYAPDGWVIENQEGQA